MNTFNKTAAKKLVGSVIVYNGETKASFVVTCYHPKTNILDLTDIETENNHELHLEGLNRMIKQDNKMKNAKPFITFE